jgi:hypothetical protein
MSNSDALNPMQLQMFMPARELIKKLPGDLPDIPVTTKEDLWARKLEESKVIPAGRRPPREGRLYDHIEAEGILVPVDVHVSDGGVIVDGHHRIAAAADIDPTMEVPVKHRGSAHQRGLRQHETP